MVDKQYLAGKTGEELKELIAQYGMPRFTASQIAAWLYRNRVKNINQMTNLSKINREKLSADFEIGYTEPIEANRRKTEQSNIFCRRREFHRNRLYSRPRACDIVCIVASRL